MAPERPRTGSEAVSPRAELRELGGAMAKDLMERRTTAWKARPLEERDAGVRHAYGDGMLQRLKGFHHEHVETIERVRKTLEPSLETISPRSIEAIDQICERLTASPPAHVEDGVANEHAYLRETSVAPLQKDPEDPTATENIRMYMIRDNVVLQDVKLLEGIRSSLPPATSPDVTAALNTLIGLLHLYRLQDPKNEIRDKVERASPGRTMMDINGKRMGKVALTGILAAGTLIFGSITLVNFIRKAREGKFELSAAPFLWGFATFLLADPTILTSMVGKNAPILNDFEEVRGVTSSKTLRTLSGRYGIGGPAWAEVVEGIFAGDHGAILASANPTDDAIANAVQSLAPKHPGVQTQLAAMMRTKDALTPKSDFARFAETLLTIKREEARDFVATYVRNDCLRFSPPSS